MVEVKESQADAADPAHGKLQSLHGPRQVQANVAAARAG
jgi:hypothetical protein